MHVGIGVTVPKGLKYLQMCERLKVGNHFITLLPFDRDEAYAVVKYCRKHGLVLSFGEVLRRGSLEISPRQWNSDANVRREEFYTKPEFERLCKAAGPSYEGRLTIGESGGILYWPKSYMLDRKIGGYRRLTPSKTMEQARNAYIAYLKEFLDYERKELGGGPLINVDSSLVFKYQAEAGIDVLCLELMPGDPHLMLAAIRGAARASGKHWGAHIAIMSYGQMTFDEIYLKRFKAALYSCYIAGAEFIYPEKGHFEFWNSRRKIEFPFHSKETRRIRRIIRESYQFSQVHSRPAAGPQTKLGIVHGHLDGAPGLWNKYVWGQYRGRKWLEGPAERGWELVDQLHRKADWSSRYVQGDADFSGNPPLGQYDAVPAEASLDTLRKYGCLVFLGWNTMTSQLYGNLKAYVKAGGHLVMFLPHLSTHVDRAQDLKLFQRGDFSDLFGVRVLGKDAAEVAGVKCVEEPSLPSYKAAYFRTKGDPWLMGIFQPARVRLAGARVIYGLSTEHPETPEGLAKRPVLVENSLGKGKAFLATLWQYPGDERIRLFAGDLLRMVSLGEQTEVRILASDRVRYAVYEDKLPDARGAYRVIYLLNTDHDCGAPVTLFLGGRAARPVHVKANDMRLAYCRNSLLLVPEDRRVDLKSWASGAEREDVVLYSVRDQKIELHNLGDSVKKVTVNGRKVVCGPGRRMPLTLKRRVAPDRRKFFARDFLSEPYVPWVQALLPY